MLGLQRSEFTIYRLDIGQPLDLVGSLDCIMKILDRYILTNFLLPFAYCLMGFVAIWLVFDLSDNAADFLKGGVPFGKILIFYATQLPDIAIISVPAGVLLALLYSLSKMSRSNEIISMLTAGVALPRILLPLFVVGFLLSCMATALNYYLVPHAQAVKTAQLDQFVSGEDADVTRLRGHLFHNRLSHRFWYTERFYPDRNLLQWVQIIQRDETGRTLFQYYVREALFEPTQRFWAFDKGMLVTYDAEGNVKTSEFLSGDTKIYDWEETPWRIASATMDAEVMTVPELQMYLFSNEDFPAVQLAAYRTHLWYRWAMPWTTFILVFIAAPLGVVFSRRGVLAGVASSIFIFASMLFLKDFLLALGAGYRIPAPLAAWLPNLIFLVIGIWLLWMRAGHRDASHLLPNWLVKRIEKKHADSISANNRQAAIATRQ